MHLEAITHAETLYYYCMLSHICTPQREWRERMPYRWATNAQMSKEKRDEQIVLS